MLEIKGVKKSYGEFQLDCSLNVEKGRITGLVGENGAVRVLCSRQCSDSFLMMPVR